MTSLLLYVMKSVVMRISYKNTGQYDISCKHFKHVYHDPVKTNKSSPSANDIFNIIFKEVITHIIHPSRTTALAQKYTTCPKYSRMLVPAILKWMKNNISLLEGSLTLASDVQGHFILEKTLIWTWIT